MTTRFWLVAAVAVASLVAAVAATASAHRVHVVTTAKNATLGKTVLVDLRGRTLYDLSVERRGRFVCTGATCLAFWHPLVVPANATPTGLGGLAVVARPDGKRQVTYRGAPLYTFSGDHARGDAKGEGIKDVGTWHAAVVGGSSAPASGSGGGGYHY